MDKYNPDAVCVKCGGDDYGVVFITGNWKGDVFLPAIQHHDDDKQVLRVVCNKCGYCFLAAPLDAAPLSRFYNPDREKQFADGESATVDRDGCFVYVAGEEIKKGDFVFIKKDGDSGFVFRT